jgi:DNA repair protein RadC
VILAHNHPGGTAAASRDDVITTRDVHRALHPLGVVLHDHFIVTSDTCLSMRMEGLLQ